MCREGGGGVALPLSTMIRELCCTQIDGYLSRLPVNPPFHTQSTRARCSATVEPRDTHKMEIVKVGRRLWGQFEKLVKIYLHHN